MTRTRILLQALSVGFVSVLGFASFAEEPTHGVTDTEIVIGTVTDLSGVTAI